ncbi:helix-turn-helix domain-containing protein [Desulfolutivibrio sulfoxidireducens]|uniref:helix-turn-helix domain-containing protein n=1 Tax=Desulfolutivibrio sulfoxidireducens TaxID=2773299 RepID=UPI00159EA966|nr:helix-turn-helix domain-containing protein [Desulfolutivibrio sulfoxidireducens]
MRHLRQSRDLTQAVLSERIGISLDYLSKIERGLASPSFFVIEKLSRHFSVSPASLFFSLNDLATSQADEETLGYRSLAFLSCVDPIFISNTDEVIVDANTVAEREFGWSAKDLLGRPMRSLIPEECLPYVSEILSLCRRGTDLRNARTSLSRRDGGRVPVLASLTLLRDERNEPARLVFLARTMPGAVQDE